MQQMPDLSRHVATRALQSGRLFEDTIEHAIRSQLLSSIFPEGGGHAANVFGLEELKSFSLRIAHPACTLLEQRLSGLENGKGAQLFASGNAAVFQTIFNICRSGDELISCENLYGSTEFTFKNILPQFNIKVRYVDVDDPNEIARAVNSNTRLIFLETLSHPQLRIRDLAAVAQIAKQQQLPLVVDSSFSPPSLLCPIDHGANIVIHSLNMWYNGHSAAPGGVVIDAGTFNWTDPKYALYNEPDPHYLGLRFAHDLGSFNSLAFLLRLRAVGIRTMGAPLAPLLASQMLEAIKTLELRTVRQSENALAVARFLEKQARVKQVSYPGLDHNLAQKYLPHGGGGMLSFSLAGGIEACQQFLSHLSIFSTSGNIGNVRSLALHPAAPLRNNSANTELYSHEVAPSIICLSLGIEAIDDILADLKRALAKLH